MVAVSRVVAVQVVRSGHIWDFLGDIWTRRTWLWMGLRVRAHVCMCAYVCICTATGMKRDFQVFA